MGPTSHTADDAMMYVHIKCSMYSNSICIIVHAVIKTRTYMYFSESDPDDDSENGGRLTAGVDNSIRYIGLQQQSIDTMDSGCMQACMMCMYTQTFVSFC